MQKRTGQRLQANDLIFLSCFFFLPSSSLILSEAPLLSTFRGADSAQVDEYGHVPISSESTERERDTKRKTEGKKQW